MKGSAAMFKRGNRMGRAIGNLKNQTISRALCRSLAPEWEKLESRLLMSTDYLLNGNQLTVITNGVSGTPTTVANVNNVQITGSAPDNITIENFAGAVTVNGGGGGDTITVYAGGGGRVTAGDSGSTPDQLVVRAPTTSADNIVASAQPADAHLR